MKIPVLDYRHPSPVERAWQFRGGFTVDGILIRNVFYVNQLLGLVGAYQNTAGKVETWHWGDVEWTAEERLIVEAPDGTLVDPKLIYDLRRIAEENGRAERFPV